MSMICDNNWTRRDFRTSGVRWYIEPETSRLQSERSTAELRAREY